MSYFKKVLSACLLSFACSTFAIAQQSVAVIDIEAAMVNSDYAKNAVRALENTPEFKSNFEKYTALKNELKELQKKGQTNSLTWSNEEKQKHVNLMEEKVGELNLVGKKLDTEKKQLENQIQRELTPKIKEIVPKIIEEKNLSVLLNAKAVYFSKEENDITLELVNRLNEANK